jgi:hypothetical protein
MTHRNFTFQAVCPWLVLLGTALSSASADIGGFSGLSGWTYNQQDSGTPPSILDGGGEVHFTTGPNNLRSLWHDAAQDISSFHPSFIYRAGGISGTTLRQGVTFAIQNSPQGLNAIGSGGVGLGYAGIVQSLAVTIENDTGPGLTFCGVYMDGVMGGSSMSIAPVSAFTLQDIDVDIAYSGSLLSVTMTQGSNVFSQSFFIGSLASILGGSRPLQTLLESRAASAAASQAQIPATCSRHGSCAKDGCPAPPRAVASADRCSAIRSPLSVAMETRVESPSASMRTQGVSL